MSSATALEAVERILNRGGEAADVVTAVVAALGERGYTALVRTHTAEIGAAADTTADVPVVFQDVPVGSVAIAGADPELTARVATLISPYVARL